MKGGGLFKRIVIYSYYQQKQSSGSQSAFMHADTELPFIDKLIMQPFLFINELIKVTSPSLICVYSYFVQPRINVTVCLILNLWELVIHPLNFPVILPVLKH